MTELTKFDAQKAKDLTDSVNEKECQKVIGEIMDLIRQAINRGEYTIYPLYEITTPDGYDPFVFGRRILDYFRSNGFQIDEVVHYDTKITYIQSIWWLDPFK